MTDDDRTRREASTRAERPSTALEPNVAATGAYLARGTLVGRYVILDVLGSGGMGVVYSAFDPELDRKVAIKLLQAQEGGSGGTSGDPKAWLVREAQALARLSHPNVVAVYDVGRLDTPLREHGDGHRGVYLVMELVEGEDLARWLGAANRTVPEILAAFVAAGRGIAAAHALGLLHRDFKPHNVLVGRDGRVRVADFGLSQARSEPSRTPTPEAPQPDDASLSLTDTGAVVGTPLYMAPEQHRGEPLDERCDQYAFCFALREALWGRPAIGEISRLLAFKSVVPVLPARAGVPARVVRAIERGLHPDPAARWPSMERLLSVLARPQRSTIPAGVAAVGLFAIGGVALAEATPEEAAGPCAAADPGWSQVWGAEAHAAVDDAFTRSAASLAGELASPLDERMSALGSGWTAARDQACARGAGAATMTCLQQQRARAHALVGLWRAGGAEAAIAAVDAASQLDDAASCDRSTRDASAPTTADDAAIAIDALLATGRASEASARATAAIPRLETIEPRAAASLSLSIGRALDESGQFAVAEAVLARGYDLAQSVDDHAASVRSAALLVTVVGTHLDRSDDGDTWARHGWAALARAGDPAPLRAVLERHLGHLAGGRGEWSRALEHYRADAEAELAASGEGSLAHARALDNVANAELHLGHDQEAITMHRRVLAIKRPRLGAHHPDVAVTLHNLASASLQLGELAEAERDCRAALAIWIAVFGERNADVALARYTLGSILLARSDTAAAVRELQAALELRRELLGDEHDDTLGTMTNLASALDAALRPQEALALLEAVVRVHRRPDVERPDRGVTLLNYGNLLRRTGALARAREIHAEAVERLQLELGADHLATGIAWYSLAIDDRMLTQLPLASSEIETSIARLRRTLPAEHPRWIGVHREHAKILLALGQRAAARTALVAALAIAETADDAEHHPEDLRRELDSLGEERPT
jgi:eukaryotic-like serine/threonine-protein kinase